MKNLTIITAEEVALAKRKGIKRAMMGADVRRHNGARSKAHASAKQYERFGRKQKNAAMRGED